jgi:hypothetical protein
MKQLLRLDWDIIAGIAAAVLAIVLHLLHVVEPELLYTITLVLLALLLLRDLRRENADERLVEIVHRMQGELREVRASVEPPAAVLIGPRHLRTESRRFVESARGEMIWFNVCCLMFQTQEVFDLLLRPAIENPHVDSLQFIARESERALWEQYMAPRIRELPQREKVREPRWRTLPETVSFILAETSPQGPTEALLSFWGEPFMSRSTGQQVPRYIFRVQGHSDLISQLVEMERRSRVSA